MSLHTQLSPPVDNAPPVKAEDLLTYISERDAQFHVRNMRVVGDERSLCVFSTTGAFTFRGAGLLDGELASGGVSGAGGGGMRRSMTTGSSLHARGSSEPKLQPFGTLRYLLLVGVLPMHQEHEEHDIAVAGYGKGRSKVRTGSSVGAGSPLSAASPPVPMRSRSQPQYSAYAVGHESRGGRGASAACSHASCATRLQANAAVLCYSHRELHTAGDSAAAKAGPWLVHGVYGLGIVPHMAPILTRPLWLHDVSGCSFDLRHRTSPAVLLRLLTFPRLSTTARYGG